MSTREERAANSIARAQKIAAVGFPNEARRKEALDYLSSAYGDLKSVVSVVSDAIWSAIRDRGTDAEQRDWDLSYPYELHHVRQKHADYALEMVPQLKDTIEQITAIKALRDQYRALALTPKVKAPVVIQPGDKTQQRGNCQCCGRDQAVNHTVAKHGYEVKHRGQGGYFSGVCGGHTFEPMQVRRDTTDSVVRRCREDAVALDARVAGLRDGSVTPNTVQGRYNSAKGEYDRLPFADGAPWEKREAIDTEVYHCESRARAARAAADGLEKLANEVHGQPLRVVKV